MEHGREWAVRKSFLGRREMRGGQGHRHARRPGSLARGESQPEAHVGEANLGIAGIDLVNLLNLASTWN